MVYPLIYAHLFQASWWSLSVMSGKVIGLKETRSQCMVDSTAKCLYVSYLLVEDSGYSLYLYFLFSCSHVQVPFLFCVVLYEHSISLSQCVGLWHHLGSFCARFREVSKVFYSNRRHSYSWFLIRSFMTYSAFAVFYLIISPKTSLCWRTMISTLLIQGPLWLFLDAWN